MRRVARDLIDITLVMMAVPMVTFIVIACGSLSINPMSWGGAGRACLALQLCIFVPWWLYHVRRTVRHGHQRRKQRPAQDVQRTA